MIKKEKTLTLNEVIEKSATEALRIQGNNGAMPSGHDGPYHDIETPVRNTSHWLITFLKAYEITGSLRFYKAAELAVNYLLSKEARPMSATFWCRKNPKKNFSNGLIGQAWVIEALIIAAKAFSRDDLINLSDEVFNLHPYDMKSGGWRIVNVDGSYGPLDFTFNHQLWFVTAGSLINQIRKRHNMEWIDDFINRLKNHLVIYNSGLIKHTSYSFLAPTAKQKVRKLLGILNNFSCRSIKIKSVGYHGFNLYGFALLKTVIPNHNFWISKKFLRTLDYAKTEDFYNDLHNNEFGVHYNPSGFEIAYAFEVFDRGSEKVRCDLVQEQLRINFKLSSNFLSRDTEDSNTMAARLYEATRLRNYSISLSV